MDNSYKTQSIVFWFRDFMGTHRQNGHTLSSRCSPRFIPERHGRWTAELLADQKSQCSGQPGVRVRSKIERGDQRECICVLTKDGDELKWLDLEVAAISILAGTRTTTPRALAGTAMLRCRERWRCSACRRRARGGSSLLQKARGQRIERWPALYFGSGNNGATRGARVGARVEERRGGAER
jgi:hypothetical protein